LDAEGKISLEFQDQLIALEPAACKFLWDFELTQKQLCSVEAITTCFSTSQSYVNYPANPALLKKWLFNLEIPFDTMVIWLNQPDSGLLLTWKMLIKFSVNIFSFSEQIIWDKTLNWTLIYGMKNDLHFGKHLIS
jgi:hypothetical protein